MPANAASTLADILASNEEQLLKAWVKHQLSATSRRSDLIKEADLRRESTEFLSTFRKAVEVGNLEETDRPAWAPAREFLADLSRSRARQGFTPSETRPSFFP
jgi:rsbT co-antagonist protein RsbR